VRARAREKVKICETCKNILGDTKKFVKFGFKILEREREEKRREEERERRAATWEKKAEETRQNEKLFFPSRFAVITLLSRSYCVLYTSI